MNSAGYVHGVGVVTGNLLKFCENLSICVGGKWLTYHRGPLCVTMAMIHVPVEHKRKSSHYMVH